MAFAMIRIGVPRCAARGQAAVLQALCGARLSGLGLALAALACAAFGGAAWGASPPGAPIAAAASTAAPAPSAGPAPIGLSAPAEPAVQSAQTSAPGVTSADGRGASPASCRQILASGNPQYPPYLWPQPRAGGKGMLIGAAADLAQWLAAEIGIPIQVLHIGPWGRVQQEVRAGKLDAIIGAFHTQARAAYMDYIEPAFRETHSVVWVGPRSALARSTWSELKGLRGATVIDNSFGEAFDRYAKENLDIQKLPSLEQAIGMLQRGRVDYLVYEDAPGEAYLARLGVAGMHKLEPPVASESLFVTLSQRSPCNTPEIRARLQRAMQAFRRDRKLMDGFIARAQQRWAAQGE